MTVMRTYLGCLTVGLSVIVCGGCSSDTCSLTCGESSAGGGGSAGQHNGAGASAGGTAGNTSGGSSSAGTGGRNEGMSGAGAGGTLGSSGSGGSGGSGSGGSSGSGGARTVDARCPAQRPTGACSADDTGLACPYDNFTGCLCFPSVAGTFTPCQKVDPTCPSTPAPAPADGAGGASGKVAPPPQQICSCSASTWSCRY
jgi:hypothetical protein